jgi:hypothetical protein
MSALQLWVYVAVVEAIIKELNALFAAGHGLKKFDLRQVQEHHNDFNAKSFEDIWKIIGQYRPRGYLLVVRKSVPNCCNK